MLKNQIYLENQTAIVTGSSSGIGEATAIEFGKAKANVVIDYVGHATPAEEVANTIIKNGGKAIVVQADVSKQADVQNLVKMAVKQFGTVDILVSNAGLQNDAKFLDMTLEKWNNVLGINLTGQFLCAQEVVKEFLRRGPRPDVSSAVGKIICMSSVHQQIPWAGHINYATAKGGVMMFMQTLAQELGGLNIRVNSIAPGAIRTAINKSGWDTPEALKKMMTLVPYNRIGEPIDIANTALFLASDLSDYIHGATIFVDGGMTLYPGFADNG